MGATSIKWRLGSGLLIRFWTDNWVDTFTLASRFPRLYALALDQDISVFCCWEQGAWNPTFQRPLIGRNETALLELMTILQPLIPDIARTDRLQWIHDEKGYSVKSAYISVENLLYQGPNWPQIIWHSQIPPKIQSFTWVAAHNALPTMDFILSRGIEISLSEHVLQRKTAEAIMGTKRLEELLETRKSSTRDNLGVYSEQAPSWQGNEKCLQRWLDDELEVMVKVHEVRCEHEKQSQVCQLWEKEIEIRDMKKKLNELMILLGKVKCKERSW